MSLEFVVPNLIAVASLLLSVGVAFWQRKVSREQALLQRRLAEIEVERFGVEVDQRNSAQLTVEITPFQAEYEHAFRVEHSAKYPFERQFKGTYFGIFGVSNAGPQPARDIKIAVVSDPPDRPLPNIEGMRDGFMSIPYLDAGKDDAFPSRASSETTDAIWVRLQWIDGRGSQETNHRLKVFRMD